VTLPHQLGTVAGQHPCLLARGRLVSDQARCLLIGDQGGFAVACLISALTQPGMQCACLCRPDVTADVGERLLEQCCRPVSQACPTSCLGRFQSQLRQCHTGPLVGVGHLVPQGERAVVLVMGLGEPVHLGGGSGRSDRRGERLGIPAGGIPVVGQLRGGLREHVGVRILGEGVGDGHVELVAFPGKRLPVHRLLQQLVPNPYASLSVTRS
jgi:hypothetical protein